MNIEGQNGQKECPKLVFDLMSFENLNFLHELNSILTQFGVRVGGGGGGQCQSCTNNSVTTRLTGKFLL